MNEAIFEKRYDTRWQFQSTRRYEEMNRDTVNNKLIKRKLNEPIWAFLPSLSFLEWFTFYKVIILTMYYCVIYMYMYKYIYYRQILKHTHM